MLLKSFTSSNRLLSVPRPSSRKVAGLTPSSKCRANASEDGRSLLGDIPYTAVSAISSIGLLETSYLTQVKLFGAPLVCPSNGCEEILSSSYSYIFGLPLSLFGMLTYGGVAALAAWASQKREEVHQDSGPLELADKGLMAGASVLASCSAVLIYILKTEFYGESCSWCYLSASLSSTLFILVIGGLLGSKRLRAAAMPGAGAFVLGLAVLFTGFADVGQSNAEISELAYYKPDVTSESSKRAISLAQRLKDSGAKMYGAFWCSHCFDQKQTFGKKAMTDFPYVECFPTGWRRGERIADVCEAAGVRAFPTWVINGRTVEGDLSLDALEQELGMPP
ncbi:hypothetical protein CEUSTIGMA_g7106.t1 [Chlamydomonas eustigma]|uniref:Vitamin K epoxide reductase domain-containing protein n=1 Tax=Chlamydomonas eustigma TaxID=1157962 RepID=A0A250X999_9CHLO|nr:hypothetical protein CEUSTIGMA_g7106.t1 [Chlamydomonas eustigma]|eukprot:GAX79665.1 hypothetical protein CEUSTIGMA_g7106.t1 [Chlamydomonas eustigma]